MLIPVRDAAFQQRFVHAAGFKAGPRVAIDKEVRVRAEGCTEVQGYLFGRPAAVADLPEVIAGFGRPVVQDTEISA